MAIRIVSIVVVVIAIIAVRPGLVSSAWTAIVVIIPFIIASDIGTAAVTATAITIVVAAVIGAITVALRAHGTGLGAYILVLVDCLMKFWGFESKYGN